MEHKENIRGKVWLYPTIIGIITLAGLIEALIGDGIWDILSWIFLCTPLVVAAFYLLRNRS